MNLRYRIYTFLFILSFINCLYKDDHLGALVSLAFIPLCFMVGSRLK